MDSDIKSIVVKVLDYSKLRVFVNEEELLGLVLRDKHNYDSTKGNFKNYFVILTRTHMRFLYKRDKDRLVRVSLRDNKIKGLLARCK